MKVKNMKNKAFILTLASLSIFSSGCAPKYGGSDHDEATIGEVSKTYEGIILSKRVVNLNGTDNGVGALAGGAVGFGLGQAVGGGHGRVAAATLGTVAGALAGNAVGKNLSSQQGYEYQIKLSSTKEVLTIAQGQEPNILVGQDVYVVKSNRGRSRVIPR